MNKCKKPRGTLDYDFYNLRLLNLVQEKLLNFALLHNYHQVITPSFENKNLFIDAIGQENEIVYKQMFSIGNDKKQKYVLKPENTASIVRYIIENKLLNNFSNLKIAYFDKFFRYERPQKNRYREFYQFGVEVFAKKSYLLDARIILFAFNALNILKIDQKLVLLINYLGNQETRKLYLKDLKSTLLTIKNNLCLFCQKRINTNLLRILDCKIDQKYFSNIPLIKNYWSVTEKEYFHKLIAILEKFTINFIIDYKLVRGLDYYNGVVFEICVVNNLESALLGGGRYDNLVSKFSNNKNNCDAFGFAIGINRVLELTNLQLKPLSQCKISFIALDEISYWFSYQKLQLLRKKKIKGALYFCQDLKLKKYFKISQKKNSVFICVISKKDIENKQVTLKNYKTKKIVKLNNIVNFLCENDG